MLKDNNRLGVIDLGTNTFHLLIVEKKHDQFKEIFRLREHIFLAQESINFIGNESMERALSTLVKFKEKLNHLQVDKVKVVGTAALRRASNADLLIQKVKDICRLEIDVISGQREAELIAQGTRLAFDNMKSNILVMDIGGGSVEFILMNQEEIFWYESYPLGVAILKKKFHKTEPISSNDKIALNSFLDEELSELKDKCLQFQPKVLVGASGSFEVLSRITNPAALGNELEEITMSSYVLMASKIVKSNREQREAIPRLASSRVDLIVVAVLLMNHIIKISQTDKILVSPYALKEGIIAEVFNF